MREVPEAYYQALVRLFHLHDQLERDLDAVSPGDPHFGRIYEKAVEAIDDQVDHIRQLRAGIADDIRKGLGG